MKELSRPLSMLLELMKASLHGIAPTPCIFEGATAKDWKTCARLAAKQGVLILASEGLSHLPFRLQPPTKLRISWQLAVEGYEKKYDRYCQVAEELTNLFLQHGIRTIVLKGVGLSSYYLIPSHREGGDLDIYTYSVNPEEMSHQEANLLVEKLMEEKGITVERDHCDKHSNFVYKGIPIENHHTFLDVGLCELTSTIEAMLMERLNPQSVLVGEERRIFIPSNEFNVLFVFYHTVRHYGSGIALHHLYDWACLIKHFGLLIPESLSEPHFRNGIKALTDLSNRYLGVNISVSGGKSLADEILEEMIDPILVKELPQKHWERIKFRVHRFCRIIQIENSILYSPWWKNTRLRSKIRNLFLNNM